MKSLAEQDHYEVLEVRRGTSQEEIERAYQLARTTYAEDSLAGYSVFGDGDVDEIRERIETAYRVLSNEHSRRAYDAWLTAGGDDPERPATEPPELPALDSSTEPAVASVEAFDELDHGSGDYDGQRLRRSRLHRGLEVEDVAAVTKVNPTYLRFIEEERFAELPARVYVRGFVAAYASCVGLDPRLVVTSYMQRFDRERPKHKQPLATGV
jgi:curved DNA-binding protein CbpA